MNTQPIKPTPEEIREIASQPDLMEQWDITSVEEMNAIIQSYYVVKFNYVNAFPGYCGDLILVQSNALADDLPVIRFIRDKEHRLILGNDRSY